jgi:RsiW-degrading membrane proteinase PrsW (M82 family)
MVQFLLFVFFFGKEDHAKIPNSLIVFYAFSGASISLMLGARNGC